MKIIKWLILTFIVVSSLSAQETYESLVDKIKAMSEDLLKGYAQPFVTAFGTGLSTGLFHTANSHDLLGFDLGVRVMYIDIPSSAHYFRGTALVCSLASGDLVYYDVELDSMPTILGPEDNLEIPTTGNAVGIPPYIPGGFNLSGVPFVIPQLNIGLPIGLEVAIRYLPFSFTSPYSNEGMSIYFLGVGAKLGINKLPFLQAVPVPIDIAVGAAYQKSNLKDSEGNTIVFTNTWNLQLLASKRLTLFEPFVGVGLENTIAHFHYEFKYTIPDTINDIPTDLSLTMHSQNHYRAMVGCTFYFGPVFLHYDYNIVPYSTHHGIIGITLR